MKIAVVGPSPVPFTIGGCENLLWGLCDTLNQKTSHQAELIKLPLKERNFWDLIDSYYSYYKLDLSHFDMIISTKYPSWMVRHNNSICYMIHELRGLYDTYANKNMPYEVAPGNLYVDRMLRYMDKYPLPYNLDYFFEQLYELKGNSQIPDEYFRFPGPFIRKLIHYMDNWGLSQPGVQKISSISKTVKNRTEYYPEGSEVQVIYPPTTLKDFTEGAYQYVFMISRLDAPKRISKLIEAMKYVKTDVKLLIAGTGPEREKLEEMAKGDSRIEFLGFVKDEEVEGYYANSLVIPYFPYDEDYGLITVEAFLHKKPVITTRDAGGPTEFVVDNETGFVVNFDAKEIAEKIEYFAKNPKEAKRMGNNGFEKVKDITWESVVEELLKLPKQQTKEIGTTEYGIYEKRKKIVAPVSFPVYPAQTGGQARVYNLYKQLATKFDVELVTFANPDAPKLNGYIADGMIENRITKSEEHFRQEQEMKKRLDVSIGDVALDTMAKLTPQFEQEFVKALEGADMISLCHPYLYTLAKPYLKDYKVIYEAHNVEYILKQSMYPKTEEGEKLLKTVYEMEKGCCEDSDLIVVCAQEDAENFKKLYGVPDEKFIVIPNGVDCENTKFVDYETRLANKKEIGLENETLALFMGSFHKPNLESCEEIFKIAPKFPEIKFLLMGSQCYNYKDKKLPENVGLLGLVSEEAKNRIFGAVDFALNPMLSGSGTNLKMFDYMSAGIPIITTSFGTRGIDNKDVFILAEVEEMETAIKNLVKGEAVKKVIKARKYVEEVFDWAVAVKPLIKTISDIL